MTPQQQMAKKKSSHEKLTGLIFIDMKHIDRLKPDEIQDIDRCVYAALLLRPAHREFPKDMPTTDDHMTQEEFADLVNIDPSRISRLLARRVLTPGLPWRCWFLQFHAYQTGVSLGRKGSGYF